jgi:hypothetical protein
MTRLRARARASPGSVAEKFCLGYFRGLSPGLQPTTLPFLASLLLPIIIAVVNLHQTFCSLVDDDCSCHISNTPRPNAHSDQLRSARRRVE